MLPLLKVTVEEVPVFNHSLPLNQTFQGESFKWTCAVTAGQGDELLWLHNEEVIPTVNNSYSEVIYLIIIARTMTSLLKNHSIHHQFLLVIISTDVQTV